MVSVNGAWMLWTVHSAKITESQRKYYRTGLPKTEPTCIIDYNYNIEAVDTVNMTLNLSQCLRKSVRWYKKIFFSSI